MPFRDWFFKDRSFHVKVVKDGEGGEEQVFPSELAKTHWEKYKKAYIIGGGAVAVAGVGGYLWGSRDLEAAGEAASQIVKPKNFMGLCYKSS